MRRDNFEWIDKIIKVMLVVSALAAIAGGFVAVHFIRKFW